jgi:hypothetical protein
LKTILQFCQLDEAPEVFAAFERDFDAAQTSHRRADALAEDVELIRKWIEPTVQWLEHTGPMDHRAE